MITPEKSRTNVAAFIVLAVWLFFVIPLLAIHLLSSKVLDDESFRSLLEITTGAGGGVFGLLQGFSLWNNTPTE